MVKLLIPHRHVASYIFFFLFLKKERSKEIQGRAKTFRPTQSTGALLTPPFTLLRTLLFFITLSDTAYSFTIIIFSWCTAYVLSILTAESASQQWVIQPLLFLVKPKEHNKTIGKR
ncbi:MAG TPA: hypothetical protein VG738_15535 [Chitinophagaceae bacterium]|nr:hypothetical protein [Chitinophagaceae bacterium]